MKNEEAKQQRTAEFMQLFNKADVDADGRLSKDEWNTFWQSVYAQY